MHVVLFAGEGNAALEGLATGGTDDVPDQQEGEGGFYRRADAFAFF
jgi:hypothetical protein